MLFADDTLIFYCADDSNTLSTVVSQELVKLHNWFAVNTLPLNVNKTSYIRFEKKEKCTLHKYNHKSREHRTSVSNKIPECNHQR